MAVLRASRFPAFLLLSLPVLLCAAPAHPQPADATGALFDLPLPGGLRAALAAVDDRVPPDRGQFLLEFIRRSYNKPVTVRNAERDRALNALLIAIDPARASSVPDAVLPLPLPAQVWIDAIFGGRETPRSLAGAIVKSRGPALLYYGLLSLDDATRAWIAGEPRLLAEVAEHLAGPFAVVAPALRVSGGAVRVPGDAPAVPLWEALAGQRATEPAAFVRALLTQQEGRLAHMFGALGTLTPAQLGVALSLDVPDAAARVAAARRLQAVFERVTANWRVDDRVFWRPPADPALFVADLPVDETGVPEIPGPRSFWTAVFGERESDAPAPDGGRADFVWLCERVFAGDRSHDRRRVQLVMFASRLLARAGNGSLADTLDAVRAAQKFPALTATLERAKIADASTFARAARRAAALSAIEDDGRAWRALAQFQGALALLTRAALRGAMDPAALAGRVASLSDVELGPRGDYEGRLIRWLDEHLPAIAGRAELDLPIAGPVERQAIAAVSGTRADARASEVEWEGTRYRLDFAAAEAIRLVRLIGEDALPFLTSARATLAAADAIAKDGIAREALQQHADAIVTMGKTLGFDRRELWNGSDVPRRCREAAAELARASAAPARQRAAAALRLIGDDLLARGLMELAYAVALGQPDRATIRADAAARRHDFGLDAPGRRDEAPWAFPTAGVGYLHGWRVAGSVLAMDVRLADFALMRLSARPPMRRPTVEDDQRRVFTEMVAIVDPAQLSEKDRQIILTALRTGRERLGAVRTAGDAGRIADEIRLGPARRTLFMWIAAKDPERVPAFLSPGELFWLGVGRAPVPGTLQAWGVPGEARLGCLCLQLAPPAPWETLAGRWHTGLAATGFPDLNLRLTELLAELGMPAPLLAPVLAPAALDLVDSAVSRDSDDRRGMVEFVQALRPDRVEQYLALLTTDGPLVPIDRDDTKKETR